LKRGYRFFEIQLFGVKGDEVACWIAGERGRPLNVADLADLIGRLSKP